jgi:prepilin-type N-terminal cleavage/methylation domain-containing protein
MKSNITRTTGFTLVEIMIVVAIMGLLASIAIPNFVQARKTAQTNSCISNLRCIDGAKQQWALETGKQDADTPTASDLQPYLGRQASGELPSCPVDPARTFATSYAPQNMATKPACLIVSTTHVLP